MEMSKAKRKILDVALELYSVYGYEATSMGQIADAVGIKKPSLYSHFSGKQAIFDTMIEETSRHYAEHSLFNAVIWDKDDTQREYYTALSPEQLARDVIAQLQFLLHDEKISRVRKLLTIEQYRNPQLAQMQEQRSYNDILRFNTGLIGCLIEKGILKDGDAELMALQYMAPISMQLYRIDRDPSVEQEALEMVRRHITRFFRLYGSEVEK